jgi:hypothetical protein
MAWESLDPPIPGIARFEDDGKRSRQRGMATEQNLHAGTVRVQLAARKSAVDWRGAGPSPLTREIPVDDFAPDEPAGWAGMTVRLKYHWSGRPLEDTGSSAVAHSPRRYSRRRHRHLQARGGRYQGGHRART